jgi:hypothetical protein
MLAGAENVLSGWPPRFELAHQARSTTQDSKQGSGIRLTDFSDNPNDPFTWQNRAFQWLNSV